MKYLLLTGIIICLSTSFTLSQEKKATNDKNEKKVYVKVVGNNKEPDVYIDGKKYDYAIVNLLDQDKIESVNVIKDEQALKKFDAPNGVILITTKKDADKHTVHIKDTKEEGKAIIEGDPIIIIDGKAGSKKDLDKLSPDGIKKIEVFKDEEAIKRYNAPYGAIIVTTK